MTLSWIKDSAEATSASSAVLNFTPSMREAFALLAFRVRPSSVTVWR